MRYRSESTHKHAHRNTPDTGGWQLALSVKTTRSPESHNLCICSARPNTSLCLCENGTAPTSGNYYYYYYYTRSTARFPGQPGQKGKTSLEMREEMTGFWDAVASAGPYVNNLNVAPDRQPYRSILTGRKLFRTPNQQCQSTEGRNGMHI